MQEDTDRHTLWHQNDATWFDVLTNAISVNRSSVGNAVYLILNMSSEKASRTNYADIEKWAAEQRMKQQQKSLMGTDAHRENLQGSVIHSSLPRRHVADDLFGGETHRSLPRYLNTDYQMSASNGNAPIPAQQYQSYQQQQPVFPPSHFVGQQQTGSASQVNAQQVYLLQQQQLQMQQQFQMMNQMQQQQQQQQQQQYTQQQQNSGQQGQVQNPYQQSGGWNT